MSHTGIDKLARDWQAKTHFWMIPVISFPDTACIQNIEFISPFFSFQKEGMYISRWNSPCRFHVCDGSKLTTAFLESEGLQTASASMQEGSAKPAAQTRLEEQQVDLMQLVQSLQGSRPTAGENVEANLKPTWQWPKVSQPRQSAYMADISDLSTTRSEDNVLSSK